MDILNSTELGDVGNLMKKARELLDAMEARDPEFNQLLNASMVCIAGADQVPANTISLNIII